MDIQKLDEMIDSSILERVSEKPKKSSSKLKNTSWGKNSLSRPKRSINSKELKAMDNELIDFRK